ncbi:putative membrane protein (plasmid) [Bacillus cereus]|nr:putative membrane protein [Bacillus cereus]
MFDIIKLCIVLIITLFLTFSIIAEFRKHQKDMFWFSIEVMFLLAGFLILKDYIVKHIT